MTPASGEQWSQSEQVPNSETPTPASGFAMDDETPPSGIAGLSGVVSDEDFGQASPTVLGGPDPLRPSPTGDAGDWPTLEYRSRAKDTGGRNWFGRRRRGE